MERALPHLQLTHLELETLCRSFFGKQGSLDSYQTLSGGAVNDTLKIIWAGKPFVLRFYLRDKGLVGIEQELYKLVEKKVSVAKRLYSNTKYKWPFALFEFCDKLHIYEAAKKDRKPLSYDLGVSLANIHSIHFLDAGLFGKEMSIETVFEKGSSPYFAYCLEHLVPSSLAYIRMGSKLAQQVLTFIKNHRTDFPVIKDGGCLVHSDFKPVNLLWKAGGGLTVLDWEFAHSGHPLFDFGILLRHFDQFPLELVTLERAYLAAGGALPENWVNQARIADFVNIIALLNAPEQRPKLFASLIKSAQLTMEKWDQLPQLLA